MDKIKELIKEYQEIINYLESCLSDKDVKDEKTRIQLKARLAQAKRFIKLAEAKK